MRRRRARTTTLEAEGSAARTPSLLNDYGSLARTGTGDRVPAAVVRELMPGRDGSMRTFHVTKLLPSGRVLLDQVSGEHAENEFERIR